MEVLTTSKPLKKTSILFSILQYNLIGLLNWLASLKTGHASWKAVKVDGHEGQHKVPECRSAIHCITEPGGMVDSCKSACVIFFFSPATCTVPGSLYAYNLFVA